MKNKVLGKLKQIIGQYKKVSVDYKKMQVNNLAKSNNMAGLEMFKNMFDNDSITFSPLSCNMALMGVMFGTDGGSRDQMMKAFAMEAVDERLLEDMKRMCGMANYEDKKTKVKMVNCLYAQAGMTFGAEFLSMISQLYEMKSANFMEAEKETSNINNYVSENTCGKIKKILNAGDINQDTKAVLVNALYFKSKWQSTFEKYNTKQRKFTTLSGTEKDADMMYQEERFPYYENDNVQVIKLAYSGKKYSMLVVLPKEGGQFLLPTAEQYEEYCRDCNPESVKLYFPKFKHETSVSLVPVIQSLGVTEIFNEGGLNKMHPNIKVDNVLQSVVVEVDENGTEAAAATAVICMNECCSMPPPNPKIFNANKPFSYFIRNTETNSIMFAGVHNG